MVRDTNCKKWNCRSVNRVIQHFKRTGSVARQLGSGRPRTARSEANKDYTEDNIQSQDNQPGTHTHVSRRGKSEMQLGLVKH